MNIINILRKPYLIMFLVPLMLFISCSQNHEPIANKKAFNYKAFNTYKELNLNIYIPSDIADITDEAEKYKNIINLINEKFDSNLSLNSLDYKYLNDSDNKLNKISKESLFLNSTDIDLLDKFESDLLKYNFQTALSLFEESVISLDLDESEFGKYNQFANVVSLMENAEPGILTKKYYKTASDCGEAIAAYSLATIGLAGCGLTGPAAPLVCGVAIAGKVLALRAMIRDCKK